MHRTMQCLTTLLLCIALALTGCSGLFGDQVTSTPALSVTPADVPPDSPATTRSSIPTQSPSPSVSHLWFRLGPPNSDLGTVTQGEMVQVSIEVGSSVPQRLNRTVVIQLQRVTVPGETETDRQTLAQIPISIPPNGSQQINRTLTFSMTGDDLRFAVLIYRDIPTGTPTEATAEISGVRNVAVVAANTTTTAALHTRHHSSQKID
jgi:hypothetical protein